MGAPSATSRAPVFLDGHATTPCFKEVVETVAYHLGEEGFGNPASPGMEGSRAAAVVKAARASVAELMGAEPEDIVFTSGATEAINLALQGLIPAVASTTDRPKVLYSPIEHSAVLKTLMAIRDQGRAELMSIPVTSSGVIDEEQLQRTLADVGPAIVVLMKANNEIGTVQPVERVAPMVQAEGGILFSDATQASAWIKPTMPGYGADLVAMSAHKMHGPPGIGALLMSPRVRGLVAPISHGGNPDGGLRPGTRNVPAIAGFGVAARRVIELRDSGVERIRAIRGGRADLLSEVGTVLFQEVERLPNSLFVYFPSVPSDVLVERLRHRVSFSTGAACSAAVGEESRVLRSLGRRNLPTDEVARIGLTWLSTRPEVLEAGAEIRSAVNLLQAGTTRSR